MPGTGIAVWERRLGSSPAPGIFGGEEIRGLPEPVQRYLTTAIAPGSALTTAVGLRMHGRIKVGHWLPFRARQALNPHEGFLWAARAAGVIAGSDRYLNGAGATQWKVAGLFTVAHGDGPDVSSSAAGRGAAEAVWVPTALLPRFGVTWSAADDEHITARYTLGETPVEVTYTLGSGGRIRSLVFDRWGDPDSTGTFGWYPFGGQITGYRTFGALTIPSAGHLGWHYGSDRWPEGEFFRFEITHLRPLNQALLLPAGDVRPCPAEQ
jgi:hypothetical protein